MEKSDSFVTVCDEFLQFTLDQCPEFGTYKGISGGRDDKLDPFTVESHNTRKEFYEKLLRKLATIERSTLNKHDQISVDILTHALKMTIDGLPYKSYLMPYNILEGPDAYFTNYTLPRCNFNTEKNYVDYLARLEAFPIQVSESIELCRMGLKEGVVEHHTVGKSIVTRLKAVLEKDIGSLPHFEPFKRLKDAEIDDTRRKALYESGKTVTQRCIVGAYHSLLIFMEEEYVPQLRSTACVGTLPGPPGLYQACLNFHCDTNLPARQLHELGKSEVNKLMENIRRVMKKVNYTGDVSNFAKFVQEQSALSFNDIADIQPYCKHVINDVIKPKLGKLFKEFKDVPFEFKEIPERTTSRGLYIAPSVDGSKPASLMLWISPDFAKFETIPLMLHEIVPGHHLQACVIQDNASLPLFRTAKDDRRYFEAPGRTPLYAAYTEGWGLYCEYLGHELGLYDDPFDEFGYLFCNLTRAARLVADTGIHEFGWGPEQLQNYIDKHAPLATQTMSEFPRFAIWPGQASSYTFGFLKIRELRKKAEKELGDRFDIREFHQECLECGPVPLQILENIIDDFIRRFQCTNSQNI